MAVKKRLYKSRLEQAIEELDNSVYVVEVDGKKVNDQRNNNYPLNHIRNVLDEGVKDVRVRSTSSNTSKKNGRTWVNKGALDDGYDFGDITKSILGTGQDLVENLHTGVIGIGEKAIDAGAYAIGGIGGALGADKFQSDMEEFIKKDLINEEAVAKKTSWFGNVFALPNLILNGDKTDENSFMGEKADSLAQSAGQLGATAGLQAVGVPWWLTTGVTSFGGATEEALNSGASYGEAGGYGLISTGAELLTEKLSGGISFGGKTLDDTLLKPLTNKITNKTLKTLVNLGIDATGEGTEEVLTEVISNVGKKLTYEDEKTWNELLTSEEAMDAYLEAYIGGAALGGGANVGNVASSIKTGRDYKTGYTQNEQSVIDKEVQNRIGEQKLTNKEISKIKEEVETDFKKGYISTDTIESTLGGDTYNQLKSIRDNKTSLEQKKAKLEQELKKLGKEFNSVENSRKYDTLQSKIKDLDKQIKQIDTNTLENQLRSEMSNKIKSDGYLQQSYLEQSKKGQLYEVTEKSDNEKINSWQQSFVDAKSNNTTKAHDFSEFGNKIIKDKNISMRAVNYDTLVEEGKMRKRVVDGNNVYEMNVNGKWKEVAVNGFKENGVLNVNLQSNRAFETTVGHELGEFIKDSDSNMYEQLKSIAVELGKADGTYNEATINKYADLYGENTDNVTDEYVNDKLGELWANEDFVNQLSTKPSLLKKIVNEIKYLVKMATTGSSEQRKLLSLQHKLENKLSEAYEKTDLTKDKSKNTKYSIQDDIEIAPNPRMSDIIEMGSKIADTLIENNPNKIDIQDVITLADNYAYGEDIDIKEVQSEKNRKFANDLTENTIKVLENYGYKLDADTEMFTKQDIRYSLSDNKGNEINPLMAKRMENSKVRDENGNLKVLYHGTATGEFTVFDKSKANPEGDWGAGFYLTDNEADVEANYEDGGADFENRIERYAHRLETESMLDGEDISYEEALHRAREQLYKGSYKITSYVNIENPAIVGETRIFDYEDYAREYNIEDYESEEDYDGDVEQLIEDDVNAAIWAIEREYDFYSGTDEIRNLLYESLNDGGIEIQQLKNRLNSLYLEDFDGNLVANDVARIIIESLGYDGIIDPTVSTKWNMNMESGTTHYIAFKSNQIKNVTNENPTDNDDINLSLSNQNDIAPRNPNLTYGEDVKLQVEEAIAPLQEEIKQLKESLQTTEEFKPLTEEDLPMFEAQNREAFNNIDESYAPIETEDNTPHQEITPTKSLFETRSYEEVGSKKINAYQYDNPEVKPYFQEEAKNMLSDLQNSTKGERMYNDDLYYESNGEQGFFGVSRHTTQDIAELLDGVDGKYKYTYAEIEKGLNAIIKDEGSENNAVSKRIEFYLDQRLRNGYTDVLGYDIPANQEYIDTLTAKEMNDYYSSLPIDDSMIPIENVSDSELPIKKLDKTTPRTTEASEPKGINKAYQLTIDGKAEKIIDNSTYNQVAEVLTTEPKTESDRNKRKWAIFKANIFDKGIVFEDLSLKTKNRELIAKWDYTLTSNARGQHVIGNGHNGQSKSLDAIRQQVDNTGLTKEFYEYMYHKHNVDRMTLDKRFQVENKPVFGESVTAEMSQAIVNKYETQHPEFMDFAQDVYDYVNADKQQLVDSGVISQEIADLWGKMYPHYVPTRRTTDTGIDINVPLDTGKTGINAPIKKATGGSADILPLFDTMAMRTLQTYRATAKNNFGVELKNTLGTTLETNQTSVDEVIDNIDSQDGLLQEGVKGKNPTFTVFENGEKITFEITKDMYDALKPVSESSMLSKTSKTLNTIGNVRRGLLTEYNPIFMFTNAIKDVQDVLINSQHAAKTYSKIPEALKQLTSKGYWYQEYVANGGEQNSYFDNETNTFKTENKGLEKVMNSFPLSTISKLNNFIEMTPRLAEYIASREAGRSIEVSMLDAARVTTNFKAGGDVTKWANRNGATFLNASVQGAMQQVRNIREANANGFRGYVNLATKFAIASLPAVLLNNLVWEDDEEYEELSDYVKQNYYVVAKDDDGTFIRIPKGRTVAVIQEAFNQMDNLITGDDEADLKTFIDLAINNLAPNNPLDNNILSPIVQVANNEAWYGGDLVPTRLQDLPASEQYDESTDKFSRWLAKNFDPLGLGAYKINYLIDQYSGGIGDVVLPMMTPEAESDGDSLKDYLIAPFKSKFTTNSTMNNQNISDFYDTSEELITNAKKSNATDKDVLSNKYINSVKAEMNELYKEKREIQNSDLPNSEKYQQVLDIQSQINELAENALSEYNSVKTSSNYSTVGDREYYKKINSEGQVEWNKVDDDLSDDLDSLGLTRSEKNTYFKAKDEISYIDKDSETKKSEIIDIIQGTGLEDNTKAYLYKKYYNTDTIDTIVKSGISVDAYFDYAKEEFVADKDSSGKTISGSRKKKVISYVNSLDLSIPEKAILIKSTNTFKFNEYNKQIVEYVGGLDISYDEKVSLLEELDMKVYADGTVKWE